MMANKHYCWLGSFVIFRGIRTIITRKPYKFVGGFQRGSGPPVPPLDPHMRTLAVKLCLCCGVVVCVLCLFIVVSWVVM